MPTSLTAIDAYDAVGDWRHIINDNFGDLNRRACREYTRNNNYAEAATTFAQNSADWIAFSEVVAANKDKWTAMSTAVHYTSGWWNGAITVIFPETGTAEELTPEAILEWLQLAYPASEYVEGQVIYVHAMNLNGVKTIHDTVLTLDELSAAGSDLYVNHVPFYVYSNQGDSWVYSEDLLPEPKDFPRYDCEPYGPFPGWPSRAACQQPLPNPLYLLKEIRCVNGQTILANIPEYDQYVGQIVNITGSEYDYLLTRIHPAFTILDYEVTPVVITGVREDNFIASDECHSCYDLTALDCGGGPELPQTKYIFSAGSFATLNFTLTADSIVEFLFVSDITKTNIGTLDNPYGWTKTVLNIDGTKHTETIVFDDNISPPQVGQLSIPLSAGDHIAMVQLHDGLYTQVNSSRIDASWKNSDCTSQTKRTHTDLGAFVGSEIKIKDSDLQWTVSKAVNCICSVDVELDPAQCYRLTTLDKSKTVYASNDLSEFVGKQVYIEGYSDVWIVYKSTDTAPTEDDTVTYSAVGVGSNADLTFNLEDERLVTFQYGFFGASGTPEAELNIKINGQEWGSPSVYYNERNLGARSTNTGFFSKVLKKGKHNVKLVTKAGSPVALNSYVRANVQCYGSSIQTQKVQDGLVSSSFTLLETSHLEITWGLLAQGGNYGEYVVQIGNKKYQSSHEIAYYANAVGDKDVSTTGVTYVTLPEGTYDISVVPKTSNTTPIRSWISVLAKAEDAEILAEKSHSSAVASQTYATATFTLVTPTIVNITWGMLGSGAGLNLPAKSGLSEYSIAINGITIDSNDTTTYYYEDHNRDSVVPTGSYRVSLDEGDYFVEILKKTGTAGQVKSWIKAYAECSAVKSDCSQAIPRRVSLVSECGAVRPIPSLVPSNTFILQACDDATDIYSTLNLSAYAGKTIKLNNNECYNVSYVAGIPEFATDNQTIHINDTFDTCCDCNPYNCSAWLLERCAGDGSATIYTMSDLSAYEGQILKLTDNHCYTLSAIDSVPEEETIETVSVSASFDTCVDCLSTAPITPVYFLLKCDLSDEFYTENEALEEFVGQTIYIQPLSSSSATEPMGCYGVYEATGEVTDPEFEIMFAGEDCTECGGYTPPVYYSYCCYPGDTFEIGCNAATIGGDCEMSLHKWTLYIGDPEGSSTEYASFSGIFNFGDVVTLSSFCFDLDGTGEFYLTYEAKDTGDPEWEDRILYTAGTIPVSSWLALGFDANFGNIVCLYDTETPMVSGAFAAAVEYNPNPLIDGYILSDCVALTSFATTAADFESYVGDYVSVNDLCYFVAADQVSASQVTGTPTDLVVVTSYPSCSACVNAGGVVITPETIYFLAVCADPCRGGYYQTPTVSSYLGSVILDNLNGNCYTVTIAESVSAGYPVSVSDPTGSWAVKTDCAACLADGGYVPPVYKCWAATRCDNPSIIYYYTTLSNGVVGVSPNPSATFAGGTQTFHGNTFYGSDGYCYQITYMEPYPCGVIPGPAGFSGRPLFNQGAYPGGCQNCIDNEGGIEIEP